MNTFLTNPPKFPSAWLDFLRRPRHAKKSSVAQPANELSSFCVPQLVSSCARETPDAKAIIAGEQVFSYSDLEMRSNAIAAHLEWLGVRSGSLVALLLERSFEFVAAALGVMKAGAAYLPLDPSYPAERISLILEDAKAPFVLVSSSDTNHFAHGPWKFIDVRKLQSTATRLVDKRPVETSASQLAYVIYTSGSTGRPKGVEITHGNLQNLIEWHVNSFLVSVSDRATFLASPGFDAAVWEIWPYLASGASLYIVDDVIRASPRALRNWMLAKQITISFVPTPVAQRLIFLDWPEKTSLRYLLTGADVLQKYPPANLPFVLVNNYGPTECTVVATSGSVSPNRRPCARPSIGRPISNAQAYVLDENLQPVPRGATGELYLAGANVGRGYRNDPKLTAEKFLANPFSSEPTSRLYKTGDLVRLLSTDELEFVGRTDNQIKIRGHRIEPDEVGAALCKHAAIQSNIIVAQQDSPEETVLVAYLTWNSGHEASATELREHLRAHVPDYMVPNTFVVVNSFPLTANGKIDRSALPKPDDSNALRDTLSSAAHSETEQKVMDIISALLHVPRISPHDNFFLLGGHSLLGAQLLAQIHSAFHVDLSLRTLFDRPTVAAISKEIDRQLAARTVNPTSLNHGNEPNTKSL